MQKGLERMIKLNLQFFGGRGASAIAISSGKIIAFRQNEKSLTYSKNNNSNDSAELWKFPGEVERVEKLESSVNSVRGIKAMGNLAMSLKRQDSHITTMIKQVESGQEEGDVNTLLTLRRRVRQAQAKLKNKRGM